MSPSTVGLAIPIIGGVVVLVIAGLRLLLRTARTLGESTRATALAGPAAQLGLMQVPDDQLTDLPPFELLNVGTDRRASNVLRGNVAGNSLVVFDYAFFDSTKTDQRFRRLHYSKDLAGATVCCAKGSWVSLPEFVMEPLLKPMLKQAEALVDHQLGTGRMASAVHAMMQAAERMVQEAPGFEFTDRPDVPYRVRGRDEAAIRARFTPRVLDYFRDHPGWIVEGRGDWLLLTIAMEMPAAAVTPQIGANVPQMEMKGAAVTIQTGANVRQHGELPADQLDTLVKSAIATLDLFDARAS